MQTNALTDFFGSLYSTDREDLEANKEKRFGRLKLLVCSLCVLDKETLWESGLLAARHYSSQINGLDEILTELETFVKEKPEGSTSTPIFAGGVPDAVADAPDTMQAAVEKQIKKYPSRTVAKVDPAAHLRQLRLKMMQSLQAVRSIDLLGSYKVAWYKGEAKELIQELVNKASTIPEAVESVETLGVVNVLLGKVDEYQKNFASKDTISKYEDTVSIEVEVQAEVPFGSGPYRVPAPATVSYEYGTVPTVDTWDLEATQAAEVIGAGGTDPAPVLPDTWDFTVGSPAPFTLSFRINNSYYVFPGLTPPTPTTTTLLAVYLNAQVQPTVPAITFQAGPDDELTAILDGAHAIEGAQLKFFALPIDPLDGGNIDEYLQLSLQWEAGASTTLNTDGPPIDTDYKFVAYNEEVDLRGNGTIEVSADLGVQEGDIVSVRYTKDDAAKGCLHKVFSVVNAGALDLLTLTPCAGGDPGTPDPPNYDGVPYTDVYVGDVVHDDPGGPNPGVNDSLTSQIYNFVAGDVGKTVVFNAGLNVGTPVTIDQVVANVAYFDPPQELLNDTYTSFYLNEDVENIRVTIDREDRKFTDPYYFKVTVASPELGITGTPKDYAEGRIVTLDGTVEEDAPLREGDILSAGGDSTVIKSLSPIKTEDLLPVSLPAVVITSGAQSGLLGVPLPEILTKNTAISEVRELVTTFENQMDAAGWEVLTTQLQTYRDAMSQLQTDLQDLVDYPVARLTGFASSLAEAGFDLAADIVRRGNLDGFLRLPFEEASRASAASKKIRDALL